jgi:HAD superfamily hydrolase (TIGR01484 family)
MMPLERFSAEAARGLRGVVFDLDGTVLTDGALTAEAYAAIGALGQSELRAIVCTGRPAAWGEVVQRQWPVDMTVTENGAVAYRSDGAAVARLDRLGVGERGRRRAKLLGVVERVRAEYPALGLADDNLGRLTDVTFDIGERHRVAAGVVSAVKDLARSLGARTFSSSIHLHVTLDSDDKISGTLRVLANAFGDDASEALGRWAFIGDSANDASCFSGFHHSFGVQNVVDHLAHMTVGPRWVSQHAQGAGFSDIVRRILALRDREHNG